MLGEKKFPVFLFIILFIIGTLMAITAIANFFKVSLSSYIPYIAWIIALGIFSLILPKKSGELFLNS
tara:strand:- start:2287 stop:2487 length:201 start_codon:yes stop_codon:yes gene_type:complete